MSANGKNKLKLLYLRRILEEETDSEHGLTMKEIIERLEEEGISAERKSIYRDIELLRSFGVDIRKYPRSPVEYGIAKRNFSLDELMLLIDAVESCKSLTQRQAKALTGNLKYMASDKQRALLDRRIHVAGRIKSKNEGVFDKIDVIHQALYEKRKIEFRYYHFGIDGERHASNDGNPYVVTPVAVNYDDGFYYLTAWSDSSESFREFRLDRIGMMRVSEDKASKNKAIAAYEFSKDDHEMFGRFAGDPITVTLRVESGKIEIIHDRFGDNAQIFPQKDGTAKAIVKVRKSCQFFGWVAGMDNAVRIESPKKIRDEYFTYLESLLKG